MQLVLQDTNILIFETHPFHLHGYSFFVVGMGYGNYDAIASPKTFNLVNPPLRNTFGVRSGGWIALRFRADNPGDWPLTSLHERFHGFVPFLLLTNKLYGWFCCLSVHQASLFSLQSNLVSRIFCVLVLVLVSPLGFSGRILLPAFPGPNNT